MSRLAGGFVNIVNRGVANAQTEVDGKPTGWKAYYDGGKWTVEDKR